MRITGSKTWHTPCAARPLRAPTSLTEVFSLPPALPSRASPPLPSIRSDRLGPDPFRLRAPPPPISRLRGTYAPADYPQLFAALDMASPPQEMPAPTSSPPAFDKIPPLSHFIWIGSDFTNPKYRDNILAWKEKTPHHTFVLWTDQRTFSEDTLEWCRTNGIRLVHLDDVFSGSTPLFCDVEYRLCRNRLPVNWGTATDILRYNILHRFGGLYSDTDLHPKYAPSVSRFLRRNLFRSYDNNDLIGATPQNRYFLTLFELIQKNFLASRVDLLHSFRDLETDPRAPFILDGLLRTGWAVMKTAELIYDEIDPIQMTNADERFGGSWTQDPWRRPPSPASFPQLVTNIMWDLISEPTSLDLSNYLPFFAHFGDLDDTQVEIVRYILKTCPERLEGVEHLHVASPRAALEIEALLKRPLLTDASLRHAAERGHLDIVKLSLERGACPFTTDSAYEHYAGQDTLILACIEGHTAIVEAILDHLDPAVVIEQMRIKNPYFFLPFYHAAMKDHGKIIELLISRGFSTEAIDPLRKEPYPVHKNPLVRASILFPDCHSQIMKTLGRDSLTLDEKLPILAMGCFCYDTRAISQMISIYGEEIFLAKDSKGHTLLYYILEFSQEDSSALRFLKMAAPSESIYEACQNIGGKWTNLQSFEEHLRDKEPYKHRYFNGFAEKAQAILEEAKALRMRAELPSVGALPAEPA